ncbi:hypothetical protein OV079_11770 [Nannocystis pusilla]|uniref:Uncharacterized protein n=1 Tax=Nannocystis pusilla TaxID=889268 RepID=A0A9X3EM56_9BACT|nr:hypothetical protein [Nannocystis pusilla]MCY1006226.1 hypothetical protein [Nannocystis pusilla]
MLAVRVWSARAHASLPRWPPTWPSAWVAPLVLAAAWSIALANEPELAAQRGLVFAGGPFLLLAGLHARLGGYLHAPERERLLPLPIEPARHFRSAGPAHRRGLALTIVAGVGAIAAATLPDGARCGWLLADFLWLALAAILVEPGIAGVAAYAGRRFPRGTGSRRRSSSARAAGRPRRPRSTCTRRRSGSGWRRWWRCRGS